MIDFINVIKDDDPLLEKITRTYVDAFPYQERRDLEEIKDLIVCNPLYTLQGIFNDGKYVGFLTYWTLPEIIYAEHFGIDKDFRNKGIGRDAFFKFVTEAPLPVVGEVEKPVEDWAKRRIEFYRRMGIKICNIPYFHPAFRPNGKEIEVYMVSYGNVDLDKDLDKVREYVYKRIFEKVPCCR